MLKLLVDTCVWLDLAKDYRQQTLLSVLDRLIQDQEVSLLLPRVVCDEFARNKSKLVEESGRSLSSVIKRVKDAVDQFGESTNKGLVLDQLNEIDHRIGTRGDVATEAIVHIEGFFSAATILEASDEIKLRSADRALAKLAPFHRQRNGMGDAVLVETYAQAVAAEPDPETRFAFITHNTKDFSDTAVDNRRPHPDIAACFTDPRSTYAISLAEVLNDIAPELLEDFKFELEWVEEPRRLSEIIAAIDELIDKVWYNRHWNRRIAIERGEIELVDKEAFPVKDHRTRPIQRDVWEGALNAAKRVEDEYGLDELGPWSDFEWGMLNGKLSALRWVLGDEWDMLDT